MDRNEKINRDVAAGLIVCDNQIQIAQRKHGKSLEYKWEFPGGKLEEGETLEECLKRELMEEMQLEITVKNHFCDSVYDYDFGTIALHAFWARCNSKDIPVVLEHEQYRWVNIRDLPNFDFAPADKPIIAEILRIGAFS